MFTDQPWRRTIFKNATRGPVVWDVKAARVHLIDTSTGVPRITLEQVAEVANTLGSKICNRRPHSWADLIERCEYHQHRNQASYESRRRCPIRADPS